MKAGFVERLFKSVFVIDGLEKLIFSEFGRHSWVLEVLSVSNDNLYIIEFPF